MVIRIQDLYTFHVVARAGTMQEAAHELGVTPGAISQRIRAIEERHGFRLFTRSKNGIMLTEAGRALHSDLHDAFSRIEHANGKHFTNRENIVRVSATTMFAHSLLVNSIGRFSDTHPAIKVSVEAEDRVVDLRSEPIDLAIRHGLGKEPGLRSDWLCSPELVLAASPLLLEKYGPIDSPHDCLKFTLLPDTTGKDWSIWFEAHGIDATNATYGTKYGNGFLTAKAASDGQGLALLNDVCVEEALATGQLIRVLDTTWPTAFAYYAVTLEETFQRPSVSTLINWLKKDLG
ncbi:MAG TPA: LysR family transcriptional regulator [Rhizobiales bacterium]|nr:LysR family transcriptional regulator [Hyphomicrobiales bacterium]